MAQHLIFGAGLIGGFMAGSFASKGLAVSVVGRESMRQRFSGDFTVTDYQGNEAVVPNINFIGADAGAEPNFDYIWLTVKCTGLDQALIDLVPYVNDRTVILSCQNGLGSDAAVKALFPENVVRRVIMTSNVAQQSDVHLHRGSQGDLFVEAHVCADGRNLAETVSTDLLVAQNIENMEAYSWAKLQLNLANAVNALADIPVKQMLEQRGFRKIIAMAMQELIDVAQAKGLALPKIAAIPMRMVPKVLNTPDWLFSLLGSKMMDIDPTVRTSMWWDLSGNRLTEVDVLNGAVVKQGQAFGITCPINQRIVDYIHNAEAAEVRKPFSHAEFLSV
ncbi:MAG: 2-dehydropantoate 2-reductase [Arenicella sp.]|jgi:2-dehydropantoate 2-reductase